MIYDGIVVLVSETAEFIEVKTSLFSHNACRAPKGPDVERKKCRKNEMRSKRLPLSFPGPVNQVSSMFLNFKQRDSFVECWLIGTGQVSCYLVTSSHVLFYLQLCNFPILFAWLM